MTTDIRVVFPAALALVLCLAACSGAGEATDASAAEHGSASASPTAVALPPGFPEKDLPLPDGELLSVAHPGNLWAVWVASADPTADLETATNLLFSHGYLLSASGPSWIELHDETRKVRIVAGHDDTYGDSLAYTLTDGSVIADDDAKDEKPAEH